jgi:hypothetical protein
LLKVRRTDQKQAACPGRDKPTRDADFGAHQGLGWYPLEAHFVVQHDFID